MRNTEINNAYRQNGSIHKGNSAQLPEYFMDVICFIPAPVANRNHTFTV